MADYKGLGESLGSAIGTGYKAQSKSYERKSGEDLYKYRQFQRQNMFDVLYSAIGLGSNLFDIYSGNQEVISRAKEQKFKVTSNWLDNLFGSVELEKGGKTYTAAQFEAIKLLGE